MFFLKNFPVKEITLKLFLVLALAITFKIIAEKNNNNKKKSPTNNSIKTIPTKKKVQKSKQEQVLSETEKLATEIELLCYLLDSREEDDNSLFDEILYKLEAIEKKAKKKNLETLISADIFDLQKKVEIYRQQTSTV